MKEEDLLNDSNRAPDRGVNKPWASPPRVPARHSPTSNPTAKSVSTTNCAVFESEAMSVGDINDRVSDESWEPINNGLRNVLFPSQTASAEHAIQSKEALATEDINDNASDISLEPIEGGLDSLFATSSTVKTKSRSKRRSKRNKKKAHTPAIENSLYTILKNMAAGKPAPPLKSGDEALLDWTSGLLASISVTSNTSAPPDPADTNNDDLVVSYASDLLTSIPVCSSTIESGQAQNQVNGAGGSNNKSSVSSNFQNIFGTPPDIDSYKSKSNTPKILTMFHKSKGRKKSQKKSTNNINSMDDDALFQYAMQLSLIEQAEKESLSDTRVNNWGSTDGKQASYANNSQVNSHLTSASIPVLSALHRISELKATERKYSAFTSANVSFGKLTKTTGESTSYKKSEHNPNKVGNKAAISTESKTTEKMDIDMSFAAMDHNSPLGAKDGSEKGTSASPNALLNQNNAQATHSLVLKETINSAPPQISAPLAQNLALAPPTSTNTTIDISRSLSALTMDPNFPHPPFKFTRLPFTVRNSIYKLLVLSPYYYRTTSPRNRRERRTNPHTPSAHTSVFLVNKLISAESRAIFYTYNVFTIGNGRWGCTLEPNLHGFQTFASIVPDQFKSMIRLMEMRIAVHKAWLSTYFQGDDRDFEELRLQEKLDGLGDLLKAEFRGITRVAIEFYLPSGHYAWGSPAYWRDKVTSAVSREEKLSSLYGLIDLPLLEYFHIHHTGPLDVIVEFSNIANDVIFKNKAEGRVAYNIGEQLYTVQEEQAGVQLEEGEILEEDKKDNKTECKHDEIQEADDQIYMKEIEYADEGGNDGRSG
ncbi:hypothetical protein ONS95_006271 [Cadophora gregata]|uniref:uncharacterized protein n=1 Tax=Cadophora gregata TaxID=51156 RepID=UPI0026DA738C|nr:uncharacterized protein ONS95_006271 [Cadophora gregata]KAK0102669.1 hypothetical protein ONS95_006271 [Cadophora gregata]KAK0104325.1 hypothetical protein ONS96_005410 [Cadophora gregata f. sp. sojae]